MGRRQPGVLSPHDLNVTALFQRILPDIEAIGSRLGAVAPAFLHASANQPPPRPIQELQSSLPETLQTVLQELQLPLPISTNSTGSWWSTADEALAYNGLAVLIVCLLSCVTLRVLMACAPGLRQRVLQPRPLSSSERLVYWWNVAFWRPDKESDAAVERDVMQIRAGVEAAMLMRYASFMIRFLLLSGLVALPLLLPLYASAAPLASDGLSTLSILHVPDGSPRLIAAATVAVVITFLHMAMAAREWRAFGRERHAWQRQDVGAHQAAVVVQCYGRGAAMLGPLELQRLLESALQAAGCEAHKLRACAELPPTTPLALLRGAFRSPRDLPPAADPGALLASPPTPNAPSSRPELSWCEARLTGYSKHFLVLLSSRHAAATCAAMPSAQLLGLRTLQTRVVPLERHMYWAGLLYTRTRTATALAAAATAIVFVLLGFVVGLVQGLVPMLDHAVATQAAFAWLQPYQGTLGWALLEGVAPSLLLLLCTLAVLKSGLLQALERLRAPPTHAATQARTCALLMAFYLGAVLLASLVAAGLFDALYPPLEEEHDLSSRSKLHVHAHDTLRGVHGAPSEGLSPEREMGPASLGAWANLLSTALSSASTHGGGKGMLLSASQQRFWLHYLASDALLLNAELLLLLPLAIELLQRVVQCCSNTFGLRSPGARRWAADELCPERQGTLTAAYGRCFFAAAVGVLFAPVAPCILLGALAYLLLFQPLWARNLAEAYAAPRADTGGRLWVEAMRYTAYAVALASLSLCGSLAGRGCPYAALAVGALPLLTLHAERRARARHLSHQQQQRLQTAADLDEAAPVDVHGPDACEPEAPLLFAALLGAQQARLQQALSKMHDLEAGAAAISKRELPDRDWPLRLDRLPSGLAAPQHAHAPMGPGSSSPLQTFVVTV